jgi:CRP/FNR family transcriptional regulator, anaerobic regulatory protein
MYDQVSAFIRKRIQISENDLESAFKYCDVKYYKKGDNILKIGEYCRFIGFVNSGLIVGMMEFNGKEIACNFTLENCFFTYAEGLSTNLPSHISFIALEDVEMLVMSKEKLQLIFSLNHKFETLFNQILAEEIRNLLIAEQNRRTQSVETRYLQFTQMYPNAFNRIPLKYIAGYLGIEAPSLSRLRKRLAGK